MIMLTVTKPRRKLRRMLKAAALVMLLAAVMPGLYYSLSAVGAMSMFASGTIEAVPEDSGQPPAAPEDAAQNTAADADTNGGNPAENAQTPAAPEDAAQDSEGGFWQSLREVIFGKEPRVEPCPD